MLTRVTRDQPAPPLFDTAKGRLLANNQEHRLKQSRFTRIHDFFTHYAVSYDDITYSDGIQWKAVQPRRREDPLAECDKLLRNPVPIISLFSGAGGFDLGASLAGYRTVLAVDVDKHSCETIRRNKAADIVLGPPDSTGDLQQIEAADLANIAGIKSRFDGVILGGPPCQPFSIAANQRFAKSGSRFKRIGFRDKRRGTLLHRFERVLLALRPAVFVLENVKGLKDVDEGRGLRAFIERLRSAGYRVAGPFVLNAADFGVPQHRQRLFVVGNRLGRDFVLAPATLSAKPLLAIDALARVPRGSANHVPRNHAIASVLRYRGLNFGQREHLGRVDRLHPFLPSKTVIAGGSNGGGRSHLHSFIPRTLTVRECARLQTFPDDYTFLGPIARQFTQVGNAVPPLLAYHIAASIYRSILA